MDDDLTISQSTSILRYLADTHPEIDEKFYPKDPKNRAKVNEFMDFFHLPMNAVSCYLHYFDIKIRILKCSCSKGTQKSNLLTSMQ